MNLDTSITVVSHWMLPNICCCVFCALEQADVFLAPQIHAGVTRFQIDMVRYET
jgi:hypothetical protein